MFELLAGKNAFENIAQCRSPRGKTIHDEVAETLPIRTVHQGWPSFAQPEHHYINSWLGHKILAPETMHQLHLKPGLEQYCVKGLVRLPKKLIGCLLLHSKVSILRRILRRREPGHDSRGDIEGNICKHFVRLTRQLVVQEIASVDSNIGPIRELLKEQS